MVKFSLRMMGLLFLKAVLLVIAVTADDIANGSAENFEVPPAAATDPGPAVEVLMHLPREFENPTSLLSYLQGARRGGEGNAEDGERSPRGRRESSGDGDDERDGDVRKREAEGGGEPAEGTAAIPSEKFDAPPVRSALRGEGPDPMAVPLLDIPEGIRRSLYMPYQSDPDRSTDVRPVNDDEDHGQRDKRTFMDVSGSERETTTALPYWKRKKENPQFVTGRDGSSQKVSGYQPAQHRSIDNARESHSLKDLDKTVQSNEISKSNQDNYYSSTNRRTYNSRQAESYTQRPPKSVYDTIDYSNKRRNQEGRGGFGRNHDDKPQPPGNGRTEQFARQYSYPRPYDRTYYPLNGDVIGRGVEYYHRSFDPVTGRIIYYANMPDSARNYDPNFVYGDPAGRSVYVNGRTYLYDPYGRSLVNPNDYRFYGGYDRAVDYMRSGRSSSDNYYYYHQGGEKSPRNARYNVGYDRVDRSKDDSRNRTYIIFDAEDNGWQERRGNAFGPQDATRFGYPAPPYDPPFSASAPAPGYPNYSYRNQYYPTTQQAPAPWVTGQKPFPPSPPTNFARGRAFNAPEVQLPITTRNRSFHPSPEYDRVSRS